MGPTSSPLGLDVNIDGNTLKCVIVYGTISHLRLAGADAMVLHSSSGSSFGLLGVETFYRSPIPAWYQSKVVSNPLEQICSFDVGTY